MNPISSLMPLRKEVTLNYNFRSGAVNVNSTSFIQDTQYLNSCYDPNGTGNNLGNKAPLNFKQLCNATYYTQYEVTDFSIGYKYTLISDPTVDVTYAQQVFTLGTGNSYPPGINYALPIEVYDTPLFTNVGSEGTNFDTRAELIITPGCKRHDLLKRGDKAIIKRSGNVKKCLKKFQHGYSDDYLQALYNANPATLLMHRVQVHNQNTITAWVMCEVDISVKVVLFNLAIANHLE